MTKRSLLTLCLLLLLAAGHAPCNGEELLLYTPKAATDDKAPASPDEGVLVKTVTVKRGDTLSKLSRKHIGIADYFPQMLVFNRIKNPDLIHPGDKVRVPVPAGKGVSKAAPAKAKKKHVSRRHPAKARKVAAAPRAHGVSAQAGEMASFQRAQDAYRNHRYQDALDLFSRFLKRYPQSRLAAEASLRRADSLLQLSGE